MQFCSNRERSPKRSGWRCESTPILESPSYRTCRRCSASRLWRATTSGEIGKGYPKKLGGDDVPLDARIFQVADAYDAIVSDRPYRKGQSDSVARTEIERHVGPQFDPKSSEHSCRSRSLVGIASRASKRRKRHEPRRSARIARREREHKHEAEYESGVVPSAKLSNDDGERDQRDERARALSPSFLRVFAHDMRGPLSAVAMNLDFVLSTSAATLEGQDEFSLGARRLSRRRGARVSSSGRPVRCQSKLARANKLMASWTSASWSRANRCRTRRRCRAAQSRHDERGDRRSGDDRPRRFLAGAAQHSRNVHSVRAFAGSHSHRRRAGRYQRDSRYRRRHPSPARSRTQPSPPMATKSRKPIAEPPQTRARTSPSTSRR